MPNYCNFEAYLVGLKEDINDFNDAMQADYSYLLNEDFIKSIGLYNEEELKNNIWEDVAYARLKAEEVGDHRAIEMLKDENLKKEYFKNIPSTKHFFRVFDYYPDDNMQEILEDKYIAMPAGTCAWSLESCVVDLYEEGYYSEVKKNTCPPNVFQGTRLVEFAKEHPSLKIALVSTEPGMAFSELFVFVDGEMRVDYCRPFEVDYEGDGTDVYPEWFKLNKNGELKIDSKYIFDLIEENDHTAI